MTEKAYCATLGDEIYTNHSCSTCERCQLMRPVQEDRNSHLIYRKSVLLTPDPLPIGRSFASRRVDIVIELATHHDMTLPPLDRLQRLLCESTNEIADFIRSEIKPTHPSLWR